MCTEYDWIIKILYVVLLLKSSSFIEWCDEHDTVHILWNLSVMTTAIIKFITCDLFSNVF